jgi:hypothetical protein
MPNSRVNACGPENGCALFRDIVSPMAAVTGSQPSGLSSSSMVSLMLGASETIVCCIAKAQCIVEMHDKEMEELVPRWGARSSKAGGAAIRSLIRSTPGLFRQSPSQHEKASHETFSDVAVLY